MTPYHPFLDHVGPVPFVHRGGAAVGDENSLEVFEQAVAAGYRYFETDVRATVDGILVAFHDASLNRMTGNTGLISELPWAEVGVARMPGGARIPRLVEVLDAFPAARVNIDVKTDDAVGPLGGLLAANPALLDRVCVGSFSDARLTHLRQRFGSALCTSTGPAGVLAHRLASFLGRPSPKSYRGDCLQVPVAVGPVRLVTRSFVDRAHEQGQPVHVWTVDDPVEMTQLLDLGVDGLMTDRPDVLRTVLLDRGQWDRI